jgi:trk system potassium uptake protein TrkA
MWDKLFGNSKNKVEVKSQTKSKNKTQTKSQNRFLVIGIGQLGESLVRNLHQDSMEVIALDNNPEHIESVKTSSSMAVVGDCMDMKVLKEIGASTVDCAVICMGTSFEATIMAIAHLVELKVPHIAVRASNTKTARIFERVGAHKVFFVENEMGKVLAHSLSRPTILHAMDLGYDLRLVEWSPSEWAIGKTLMELNLPNEYNVQVVALRDRNIPNEIIFPKANLILESHHLTLLVGMDQDLDRLQERK